MNRIEKQIGKHVVIHDNDQSGAMLAWRFFHPGTDVPMLIQHIDDRDRWQWKLDGSAELHAALASIKPWSFEQWKDVFWNTHHCEFFSLDALGLYDEGAAILRAQDAHVQSMLKQARKCAIDLSVCANTWRMDAPVGLAVNATLHMSEVGHELANQSCTYGLVYYVGADNRIKCSLRSNGEYDVSAIARAFGGGGHRNAAAFETDINTLMRWLK